MIRNSRERTRLEGPRRQSPDALVYHGRECTGLGDPPKSLFEINKCPMDWFVTVEDGIGLKTGKLVIM